MIIRSLISSTGKKLRVSFFGFAVRGDGPDQLFLSPVRRDFHAENEHCCRLGRK